MDGPWDGCCEDCGEPCVKLDVGNAGNYFGWFLPGLRARSVLRQQLSATLFGTQSHT